MHKGKTHLAQAPGLRHLYTSLADQSWERQLRRYLHPDLLIIDDFGLTSLTQVQAEDIYEVVAERYLTSSIIITSNRPPKDWVALFPDPVMANPALDG